MKINVPSIYIQEVSLDLQEPGEEQITRTTGFIALNDATDNDATYYVTALLLPDRNRRLAIVNPFLRVLTDHLKYSVNLWSLYPLLAGDYYERERQFVSPIDLIGTTQDELGYSPNGEYYLRAIFDFKSKLEEPKLHKGSFNQIPAPLKKPLTRLIREDSTAVLPSIFDVHLISYKLIN